MKIGEEWKQLRHQIGQFISHVNGLYKGAENLDELVDKVEQRGYKKGFTDGESKKCEECSCEQFCKDCNGHYLFIHQFLLLDDQQKSAVQKMVELLSK